MKKEDKKNKKEIHEDYETNRKMSREIHEKVKKLGYDYVLKKLQKYGFSDAESLTKKMLSDER